MEIKNMFVNKNRLLYSFFWVIPRHLKFMYRHFGTLCQFYLHRCCKQEE